MKKFLFLALLMLGMVSIGSVAFADQIPDPPSTVSNPYSYPNNIIDGDGKVLTSVEGFGPAYFNAQGRWVGTMEIQKKDTNTFHLSWNQQSVYQPFDGTVVDTLGTKLDGGYYAVGVYTGWTNAANSTSSLDNSDYSNYYIPQGVTTFVVGQDTTSDGTSTGIHYGNTVTSMDIIIPGGIKDKTDYVFAYKAVDAKGDFSSEYFAYYLTNRQNDAVIHTASYTGQTIDDRSGYNSSGITLLNRDWKGQTTHGNYQYNTNSCAGCHKFHQGQGEMLLFTSTETALCESCHDGTTSGGNISLMSNAGAFHWDSSNQTGTSQHDVGGVELSAAPGGDGTNTTSGWDSTLECSSCHNPHGPVGSPHYATPTDNSLASAPTTQVNTFSRVARFFAASAVTASGPSRSFLLRFDTITNPMRDNDNKDLNLTTLDADAEVKVFTSEPKASDTTGLFPYYGQYILIPTKVDSDDGKVFGGALWGTVAGNNVTGVINDGLTKGSYVLMPYIWVNKLIGYIQVNPVMTGAPVQVNGNDLSGLIVDSRGFIYGTGIAETTGQTDNGNGATGTLSISGVKYQFNVSAWKYDKTSPIDGHGKAVNPDYAGKVDNNSYWNSDSYNYQVGNGQSLTLFCAQCHPDYLSGTHKDNTGTYTHAMRHKVTGDSLSCTRCHFSHGSSEVEMRDGAGWSAADIAALNPAEKSYLDGSGLNIAGNATAALSYIQDTGIDSANKRFTGFSVCLQCHADVALGKGATVGGNPISTSHGSKICNQPF